jgi:hypothetical protein
LADALDLGSSAARRAGSSPALRTSTLACHVNQLIQPRFFHAELFDRKCKPTAKTVPLERRIDMTVPLADIEKDVDQRLKQMARTVKMAGFRPGKVPMKMVAQHYGGQARSEAIGAAVKRPSASRCASRTCASPAIRASSRRPAPPRASWLHRDVRGLPRDQAGRRSARGNRAPTLDGGRRRGRQDPGSPAQAAHHLQRGRARLGKGRPRGDRFHRPQERRGVPGRPGQRLPRRGRRRHDAAGLRDATRRPQGRREQDLRPDLPGRLSGRRTGRQDRSVRDDGEGSRRRSCPKSTPSSPSRSASPMATSPRCAPRCGPTWSAK